MDTDLPHFSHVLFGKHIVVKVADLFAQPDSAQPMLRIREALQCTAELSKESARKYVSLEN